MQPYIVNSCRASPSFVNINGQQSNGKTSATAHRQIPYIVQCSPYNPRVSMINTMNPGLTRFNSKIKHLVARAVDDEDKGESSDAEDELCPVDCVREFKTREEFYRILEKAKNSKSLVVVDFFRTSCGSCKYIEQGFSKLCKGSGDEDAPIIFLKHNVMDEYDEQSEVAEELRIKVVPLFHFYKDGVLLEAFPTRDKEKITEAILRYTSAASLGN